MFVFGGEACAIQPEVRYFRTSNRIFPGSFVSRPLVKGNEDPGYEGAVLCAFARVLYQACKPFWGPRQHFSVDGKHFVRFYRIIVDGEHFVHFQIYLD